MKFKVKLREPAYSSTCFLIVHPSRLELEDYVYRTYGVRLATGSYDATGAFFTIEHPEKKHILNFLWLEKFDWSIPDQGILHHELMHMTFEIMRIVGIDLCKESEEAFTHVHARLVMESLHHLKKLHPDFKKK